MSATTLSGCSGRSAWNLYHVTAGTVLKFNPFDLTMGLSYAAGGELVKDLPWTGVESPNPDLVQLPDKARVQSFTINGIVALAFHF